MSPSVSDEYVSRGVRFPIIQNELSNLLGQILTIVDSAYTNPVQNKALKDLVRQRFGHKVHDVFWEYCYRKDFNLSCDEWYRVNIIDSKLKHSDPLPPIPPRGFDMPEVAE